MHRRSRTVVAVLSLALAGSATAVAGSGHWHNTPGRPSVTPPPWSNGHCKDGQRPPCRVGHDDDHGKGENGKDDHDGKSGSRRGKHRG